MRGDSEGLAAKRRIALPHSVLVRTSLFVAAVVILIAGLLGHLAYVTAREILHDNIHNRLRLLASERAARLESHVRRHLEQASLLAERLRRGPLLQHSIDENLAIAAFRARGDQILAEALRNSSSFREVWIADPDGEVIAASDPMKVGWKLADDPDFLAGKKQPHLGIPQQTNGLWLSRVTAPIRNEQNQLLGVLLLEYDATPLRNLLDDRTGLEESGEILVGTENDGIAQYLFSSAEEAHPDRPLARAEPLALALAGQKGAEVTREEGADVLTAFQPVAYQPNGQRSWGLVAKMNLGEAYAPVRQLRRTLVTLQIAMVLLGILVSFLLVRRFTRPVLQLADAALTISQGDLETRVPVTTQDEIGLLGTAFNTMAEQLTESRDRLEERVEQRTAELDHAQKELRQQTRILRSVLDSMADGVIVADQHGKFLLWNPAAERLVGIGPQDVSPEEWPQLYGCHRPDGTLCPPDELPLARAIRGEAVDGQELLLRNPNLAEEVWISINARPLKSGRGERRGGVIVFRDVTAARKAEEEIKVRDEKNRTILATAHEAFIALDEESRIMEWNEQAEATFGWKAEEVIGQSFPELVIPPVFREAHRQGVVRFLETGEGPVFHQRLELKALHADGHEFPIEITIAPVRQASGYLFAAFLHDITEEKKAKQELEAAKEAAEAANRAKSSFLANMSHEIRTPMNAVIGMTELVLESELTPAQRERLSMVQESAESLLLVINDILDFSKIEAGRFDLEHAAFELPGSLGDLMKSLALRAHGKGLELAWHVPPEVPVYLVGDRYRLRQILVNLVGNAIKFTDSGEIVLKVEIEARSEDDVLLHFSVRDTGVGIPPEQQARIFEAFEQADESTSRRHGGTGLGLAICARLVELMGGRIWLESEANQGSTFHFTARFGLPAEDQLPKKRPYPKEGLEGLRVLIVDDNATNCQILEETLRHWRMQPTAITHSEDAVPQMKEQLRAGQAFDLVLLDANMPGQNGFRVAEAIRQERELGSAITMMLTSNDRREELAYCREMGIAAYLTKPVKPSELFNAIARSLGLGDTEEETEPTSEEGIRRLPPLQILLAEDSVVNQKLALAQLEPRGHRVTVANNGREAVRLWNAHSFDLILMDVQMPEMDGLTATRTIRQSEQEKENGHTPIVAMTAHAMKGDREECLEAGMDGYVSKPVRARELFAAIKEILPASLQEERPEVPSEEPAPTKTMPSAIDTDLAENRDILDWEEAARRSQLDAQALREMAELFLEEITRLHQECQESLAAGDLVALRRGAHTIKGAAAVFAAEPTTQAAQRLETLAKEGRSEEAPRALAELEQELNRLKPLLIQRIEGVTFQEE